MKKFRPNIIGPLNAYQFLSYLFGFIILGILYRYFSFTKMVVFGIIVLVASHYFALSQKNDITLYDFDEEVLQKQKAMMQKDEYKMFLTQTSRMIKREIFINQEKMKSGHDSNYEKKLLVLQDKNKLFENEIQNNKNS